MNPLPDDFFRPLSPGFFLRWAAKEASRAYQEANVLVFSEMQGPICGISRPDAKQTVILITDDAKCGIVQTNGVKWTLTTA